MDVRYNFVYNVISNYCVVEGIEVEKKASTGKKDIIIGLHKEGKTKKEISVELKTNYNYIYQVIKKYETEQAVQTTADGTLLVDLTKVEVEG